MKRSLFAIALLFSILSTSSKAMAWGSFGAIAWSPSTNRYGFSTNSVTLWDAQATALSYCYAWDCQVVVSVQNGCAALSTGAYAAHGYAWGVNRWDVVERALFNCSQFGPGCRLLAWTCTPGY